MKTQSTAMPITSMLANPAAVTVPAKQQAPVETEAQMYARIAKTLQKSKLGWYDVAVWTLSLSSLVVCLCRLLWMGAM